MNRLPNPRRPAVHLASVLLVLTAVLFAEAGDGAVRTGADVLLATDPPPLRGRRIGLVTNPTGVTRSLESLAAAMDRTDGFRVVAFYGPEHGVRGDAQAGEKVSLQWDPVLKRPLFSLYGKTLKPTGAMLTNIAGLVRGAEGFPTNAVVADRVDVLVFDIQDVGSRAYTFIGTLSKVLEAAAENDVPVVVLDRPNPLGGTVLEGPVLEAPKFLSLVGIHPIPMRHGMTVGELARLFNARFLAKPADLTVIPMKGWDARVMPEETGLPWVMPSPNMPTPDTAFVYPGQVLLEGTNLSEGRGTTRPFELFGAPWLEANALVADLNALKLPGVVFREAWFTPTFSKHAGKRCGGVQIHVTDRRAYRPVATTLRILDRIRRLHPDQLTFQASHFDRLMGTDRTRKVLESGGDIVAEIASFEADLRGFETLRKPYLLYPR